MKKIILDKIRENRPQVAREPSLDQFSVFQTSTVGRNQHSGDIFAKSLSNIGAAVLRCSNNEEILNAINKQHPNAKRIVNTVSSLRLDGLDIGVINSPKDLHPLDLSIVQGDFGVIENGAIWISDSSLRMRAIPFIAEHLIILLSEKNIVENMHDAYERLEDDGADYGVFIAGPSKTADIEQCLVIGAQGARSLLVILTT